MNELWGSQVEKERKGKEVKSGSNIWSGLSRGLGREVTLARGPGEG